MAVDEIALAGGPSSVLRMPAPPALEWLELSSDDRTARFVSLTSDLSRPFQSTGDGKRISSAHASAGMGAALAWAAVCRDQGAMPGQSIDSFATRWSKIRKSAPKSPCHYVSLGPGDGRKDAVLLADLARLSDKNQDLCYLAVDTSEELLHLAVRGVIRRLGLPSDRIMSLPWDFSRKETTATLRRLLDELFDATPVLFSLLGNTIAQFDNDTTVLTQLASLLRPDDRLLLEVEATAALTEGLAAQSADEHRQTPTYGEHATSTLRHHTNHHLEWNEVEYLGSVEPNRALKTKTIHRSIEETALTLPNGKKTSFAINDTIRLSLSRKYSPEGLAKTLETATLTTTADICTPTRGPFGQALLMLKKK